MMNVKIVSGYVVTSTLPVLLSLNWKRCR